MEKDCVKSTISESDREKVMKYGIYYAYWAKDWGGDFIPYITKVKKLGFDVLEVNCGRFQELDKSYFRELRHISESEGVLLSGGYGPRPEHNLSSADTSLVENAFRFWEDVFAKMELAGIDRIGGALYSYWPVDFRNGFDKKEDTRRSIENMKKLADIANSYGITLNMEVLNRFEGYMLNECEEAVHFVNAINKPNVKIQLDTFHMNIEEDSLIDAIYIAGNLLGHFHIGEANRRPPNPNGRIPWNSIGKALKDIGYDQYVVMEPFERMGGQVGKDISIWRDLSHGSTELDLDNKASRSVAYIRSLWEK